MNARAIIETEDPKRFLRQAGSQLRYEKYARGSCRIWAQDGSYIEYSVELSGTPVVRNLKYSDKVPEEIWPRVGLRLLNAAYDYSRSMHEHRIRVSAGTTFYERSHFTWDLDRDDPAELGNLVNVAKEGVTGTSGMVRHITLESEDPKSVFRQVVHARWTMDQLRKHLEPLGFEYQPMGCRCMEKQIGGRLYSISTSTVPEKAFIVVYERTQGNRWQHKTDFTVPYRDLVHTNFIHKMTMVTHPGRGAFQHENVMALDPHGGLKLDTRPKAPHSIWTYQRKDPKNNPLPYHRTRTLPNGLPLEMYIAYRKDNAPIELLSRVKQYGPAVARLAIWAATDLAYALQQEGVTLVLPMPSAKPLARRLARLISNRLGVPLEQRVAKTGQVRHIPISKRKAVAARLYSVSGKLRGEVVCLVDDYIVTSASMMAAAVHAYQAGARKVVGAALAI